MNLQQRKLIAVEMEGIYAGYVSPVAISVPSPLLRTQEELVHLRVASDLNSDSLIASRTASGWLPNLNKGAP